MSIATRAGGKMMLRDSTHANTSLTFEQYYPGFTLPILDSASGKLSMAYAEPEERETILRWMRMSEDIDANYLKIAEGRLDIEKTQKHGYALQGRNDFNLNPGKTASIAVPIFLNGNFEAAMTMVFFVAAMRIGTAVTTYIDDLKATAAAISKSLSEVDRRPSSISPASISPFLQRRAAMRSKYAPAA